MPPCILDIESSSLRYGFRARHIATSAHFLEHLAYLIGLHSAFDIEHANGGFLLTGFHLAGINAYHLA